MPMSPQPSDLTALSLAEVARLAASAKLPPVGRWNPAHCGDSEMRIARDGTWYHQGAPITRPEMVRLFSTILRRERDGTHDLVTPVEKLSITVEDAPFRAVEMKADGDGADATLAFRLNTDELIVAGPENPLRFAQIGEEPRPYLAVRAGLEALIARALFYDLAERATEGPGGLLGVWSSGAFFAMETCS